MALLGRLLSPQDDADGNADRVKAVTIRFESPGEKNPVR